MQPCIILFLSCLFYSINLVRAFISIIIWLNKNIILINKFSKHNWINVLSYEIKYLDLYISLYFSCFIFNYHLWLLLTYIVFNVFFITCIHKLFLFSFRIFLTKNMSKMPVYTFFFGKKYLYLKQFLFLILLFYTFREYNIMKLCLWWARWAKRDKIGSKGILDIC